MGTRSRIGLENEDGTVISCYCHWDGYPSHNGKILKEHYSDPEKLRMLISFGDLSILAPEIYPPVGIPHGFGYGEGPDPVKGVCVFYGRDRGEENVDYCISPTRNNFLNIEYGEKYYYLFTKDNEWLYDNCDGQLLRPLTDKTIETNK